MRKVFIVLFLYLLAGLSGVYSQGQKEFRLANIFGDDMVIQRGMQFPVWGFAEPGTEVRVSLLNREFKTNTDREGKWLVKLPPMNAGGPHELKVFGSRTVVLKNVMIGEVWLASGQSNMEFTMRKTLSAAEDIAAANYPDIRVFSVPFNVSMTPQQDIKPNKWRICTPGNAGYFPAVAYHFARELHQNLKVPVGIINSSKGGTPAEAWTSAEMLVAMPEFKDKMLSLKKDPAKWDADARESMRQQNERTRIVRTAAEGIKMGVHTASFDDRAWAEKEYPVDMPKAGKAGYWGFVWFRKNFSLTKSDLTQPLNLRLPFVSEQYVLYFNGVEIGKGDTSLASFAIPPNHMKEGDNVLAVRILSYYGKGQLGKENEQAFIISADKKRNIPLDGKWKFNFTIEPRIVGAQSFAKTPSVLYNAMISPLIPFPIKGVIWYQGEANTTNPQLYHSLFPAMIEDWRSAWNLGEFPFAYVQLAGYSRPEDEDLKWALLREAQFASLKIPNTIMATAIDVGEEKDIHPRNKKEVGHRLALAVRSEVYGERIVHSGPVFKNFTIRGGKALIEFSGVGGGLTAKDGKSLTAFEIAGEDKVFYPAEGTIINNKVSVSSGKVPKPVAVRYAFRSFPAVNLYNKEGLPALPFRTDAWVVE